jgi:hypothetical protein
MTIVEATEADVLPSVEILLGSYLGERETGKAGVIPLNY